MKLGAASATSVYGGAGNDSIVLSGSTDGGGNLFTLGDGGDTIFFQSAGASSLSGATVDGGAGADSINIGAVSAGAANSALIKGGAGDDTINFTDLRLAGSAGAVATTIKGGAGADVLQISAVGSGAGAGSAIFAYDAFSESTLSGMDTLTFSTAAVSAGLGSFGSSQILINVGMGLNTGVSGAGAVSQVSASGGFVVFSGYSDNSLTARVSAIDAGYTTTGDFAVFSTDGTTRYLFVQGGTTDLVATLSNEDSLSAGGTIIRSGNTIGF